MRTHLLRLMSVLVAVVAVWSGVAGVAAAAPCDGSQNGMSCGVHDGGSLPGSPTHAATTPHVKPPIPLCSVFPAGSIIALAGTPREDLGVDPDWIGVTCRDPDWLGVVYFPRRVAAEQMAWYLVDQIHLVPVRIGSTPLRSGPDSMGLVGLPVWLWVDGPSATNWGPIRASAGGVSLVAQVESITWSMGDGTTFTCGQGTAWTPALGAGESPTCGHVYVRQGTYTITATTHWVARWSGYGESGSMRFPLRTTRTYRVGELQVIVTRR